MQFHRYMTTDAFAHEIDCLHAFHGRKVGSSLLEYLEKQGLLCPRMRIRYPDPVARRFWLMAHEHWGPRQLRHPTEPDGPRWDAAVELDQAFYRWRNSLAYGPSVNPLDNLAPRFSEFIQRPSVATFEAWLDMRVDVSNDVETNMFDGINVETYYSTWQVLLAAEVVDAGVHIRINLGDEVILRRAVEALEAGRLPDGSEPSYDFTPFHAARGFADHWPAAKLAMAGIRHDDRSHRFFDSYLAGSRSLVFRSVRVALVSSFPALIPKRETHPLQRVGFYRPWLGWV
jgi:hypothetical protein